MLENENNLLELIDFIHDNKSKFKNIFYPGAGYDFSPLQVFGKYGSPENIYLVDFDPSNIIRDRIDNRAACVLKLSPADFGKSNWAEFFPADENSQNIQNPWGRRIWFNRSNDFNLFYLQTEAVETVKILIENNIIPDVLVYKEGYFGESSYLFEAMINNMPAYIMSAPSEPNMWQGYKQITKSYQPAVYDSSSFRRCPIALFAREDN